MSVKVMALVWEADLPPMEKLVLLALADCANDEGRCWPSAPTLAKKSGQCERTVRKCIRSLIASKHLSEEQRSGTSTIFTVHPCISCTPASRAPLQEMHSTPASRAPKPSRTVSSSSEPKGSSLRAWALPVGVSLQVWTDLMTNRKRKRLSNTPTAWKQFNDDLTEHVHHAFNAVARLKPGISMAQARDEVGRLHQQESAGLSYAPAVIPGRNRHPEKSAFPPPCGGGLGRGVAQQSVSVVDG